MDGAQIKERFHAWDEQLARHDRIEVGLRRGRLTALALISLVFAVIGGVIAVGGRGTDLVMGVFCLVFMGACFVVLARQAFRHGPAAVITSRDIASPLHDWSVPWPAVRGAFVFSTRGNHMVTVVVDPEWYAAWVNEQTLVKRLLARVNRAFLRVEAMSLPGQLDVHPQLLAAWIDARGTDPQADAVGEVSPD